MPPKKYETKEDYLEAKRKRNAQYVAESTVRVAVNLNKNTDTDILDFLETVDNKQGFIKELIRDYIAGRTGEG